MWMLLLLIKVFKIKNMALMMITSCLSQTYLFGDPGKFVSVPKGLQVKGGWPLQF